MERVLRAIVSGGVVVYPTETLYALGCDGRIPSACARVAKIKGRPSAKPLPLVVGGLEQLSLVTGDIPDMLLRLGGRFWPGPLSVLVRARPELAPQVMDGSGCVSVRVTPHPAASRLCLLAQAPLVATSANLSGRSPVSDPGQLDPAVLEGADAVYAEPPFPGGGEPSTVVRCRTGNRLDVLRIGAVSLRELEDAGFHPEAVG